jgi:hypothetical protein
MFVIKVEANFYFKCDEYKTELSYSNKNSAFVYFDILSNIDFYLEYRKMMLSIPPIYLLIFLSKNIVTSY